MNLIEYFRDERFVSYWNYDWYTKEIDYTFPTQRHRMIMKDGFSMSVQASDTHYCHPRQNLALQDAHYYEYEIGFPSERVESLIDFAEQPEKPTETVYAYVPAAVVQGVIDLHGGIDVEATLARIEVMKEKEKSDE